MQTHTRKYFRHTLEPFNLASIREDQSEGVDPKLKTSQSVIEKDDTFINVPDDADMITSFPSSTAAVDASLLEEDMLAYLYPLNNPLDKCYFSEQNDELLNFHVQGLKHPLSGQRIIEDQQQTKPLYCGILPSSKGAAVMSLGARGSAEYMAWSDLELKTDNVFDRSVQVYQNLPDIDCKGLSYSQPFLSTSSSSISHPLDTSMFMLPPRRPIHNISPSNNIVCPMNFSYFSRPTVIPKATMETLGMYNICKDDRSIMEGSAETHFSIIESPSHVSQKVDSQCSLISSQEALHIEGNTTLNKHRKAEFLKMDGRKNMHARNAGQIDHTEPENVVAIEPTITTSSGGSGIGFERYQERNYTNGKRKLEEVEDSPDCQSEVGKATTRRSRAAEIHNLSERRRRDRINQKMKALQELIPNCNKTDKASLLDGATEYVKMLQVQLQILSARTGLSIPPLILPSAAQHLNMFQPVNKANPITAVNRGSGTGTKPGMRIGLIDMRTMGSGRPLAPLTPISLNTAMPSAMGAESHGLSTSGVFDLYRHYASPPQLPAQMLNIDPHQTYLLHQRQQQQLHNHQAQLQSCSTAGGGVCQ
ncbi:hypothetical protein O6H91_14G069400 [Diphasiastrum complanatum]|uniref:Uncharacterized protein n=1 Tax=Diphasiastrum complanatum TaxID=34168 RepID=A0ACC2BQJ6_DIPCM|nr:hypothetical protein O6H91_14G069400 [Diphasiastrum complanatum]